MANRELLATLTPVGNADLALISRLSASLSFQGSFFLEKQRIFTPSSLIVAGDLHPIVATPGALLTNDLSHKAIYWDGVRPRVHGSKRVVIYAPITETCLIGLRKDMADAGERVHVVDWQEAEESAVNVENLVTELRNGGIVA